MSQLDRDTNYISSSNLYSISRGVIKGAKLINKFGRNADIDTGAEEDVWAGGGLYTGFPTGAEELVTVSSSSTDDTAAGSGARTVELQGLSKGYQEQSEIVTLDGTTLVDSQLTYKRLNRLKVLTSGSGNTAFNAGTLTVAHKVTTANVFVVVPEGSNQSQVGCYTIPAGKTGYLVFLDVREQRSNSATADGAFYVGNFGMAPRLTNIFSISQNSNFNLSGKAFDTFQEKTDIAVRITEVSANNTEVVTNFSVVLYDN